MELELLDALNDPWNPVSRPARIASLAFFGIFLVYALTTKSNFLFIDMVFLPIHEGGHLMFSYFGETLHILGGTILQLLVPFALAIYFLFQRHLTGTAFAAFFFFENFLNVGTYMADARAIALDYVTVGEGEAEHDWTSMFLKLGLLDHDVTIGHAVRLLGWLGMLGVVVWLWWRTRAAAVANRPQTPIQR